MKHIKTFESFVQESLSSSDKGSMNKMISHIKSGMGWIDPYYVEDTFSALQKEDGVFAGKVFNNLKNDIYQALIDADLLYFASDKDEEKKGKKVSKTSEI